jgi:hypothetical protein
MVAASQWLSAPAAGLQRAEPEPNVARTEAGGAVNGLSITGIDLPKP